MDGQINAGVNELLNISAYVDLTELSIGVKEDIIRCDSCCMDSDRYITLRSSCTLHENALTNGSEVAIVDIARKTTSTRRYGLIHEARMNPTLPVIALRAGQKLQLFNIELNSKIKSFEMPVPVEFLKWTSADHLALVTARAVFHWSVENDTEPVKVFDRAEPMLTGRVADYLVSNDCKYCILIALSLGVKTSGNQRPINGLMQLHSTETGASRLLHGLSAVFATLNTTASNSSILCFEGKKSHASAMLVLMTIETTKGFDWRSQKHQIPSHTDYDFDFPVAMIVFRKNDMLYMVSDMGYLYVFDGTTAKPIYYVRVTPDKIFTACGHLSSGGLLYISPCKGRVRLVTLNEVVVVHYVMNTLGDKELAGQLASRFGVVLDDSRAVQAIDDGIQRSDAQPLSPKSNAKRVLLTYAYAPPLPGHMNSNDETNYAMVCRLLQHEMDARKELDIKNSELERQVYTTKQELLRMQADLSVYRTKLDQYLAVGVDTWTMSQCEAVEVQLKSSPEAISKRKEHIARHVVEESRLCVVCMAKSRNIVLFPCRHLCICNDCAALQTLNACPLCRAAISQRVSVFS